MVYKEENLRCAHQAGRFLLLYVLQNFSSHCQYLAMLGQVRLTLQLTQVILMIQISNTAWTRKSRLNIFWYTHTNSWRPLYSMIMGRSAQTVLHNT